MKSKKILLSLVCVLLFIIPFFWLKPNEMDLGGDGHRTYFYKPLWYLENSSLFGLDLQGTGNVAPQHVFLPYLILLSLIYNVVHSPYILISIANGIKLSISFLSIYLIIRQILLISPHKLKNNLIELSSFLSGLFYIFSTSFTGNLALATSAQDSIFVYPMIFYLFLRFFLTNGDIYLWLIILISLVFSPNFSLLYPPFFFAFFLLALPFLLIYVIFICKPSISWKKLLSSFILLLSIHSYHLFPEIGHVFDSQSSFNIRAFNKDSVVVESLNYFINTLPNGKIATHLFLRSPFDTFAWTSFLAPLIIILGLILNKNKKRLLLLTVIFYLISLYLMTANITKLGVNVYKQFFLYIPGFGMFRDFEGKWQFIYMFFYSLLFGQSFYNLTSGIRQKKVLIISCLIIFFLLINSWKLISGQVINPVSRASSGLQTLMVMDKRYEDTLLFLRSLTDNGKIISIPFGDFQYQVVHGVNNGAYIGSTMIPYLTGKNDFAGYSTIVPFPEVFLKLIREKNYPAVKRLFGLLNIRYIFYNSDRRIYDSNVPSFPYDYSRKFFPITQKELELVIKNISYKQIYQNGPYRVYVTDNIFYLPRIYIPKEIKFYQDDKDDYNGENASFFVEDVPDPFIAYLKTKDCTTPLKEDECSRIYKSKNNSIPTVKYKKINPVKYIVEINDAKSPYFLVMSDSFQKKWKVYISHDPKLENEKVQSSYFNGKIIEYFHSNIFWDKQIFETFGMPIIPEDRHIKMNGYANGWYILPTDVNNSSNYSLIIEMTGQRNFYIGLFISLLTIIPYLMWFLFICYKKIKSRRTQ